MLVVAFPLLQEEVRGWNPPKKNHKHFKLETSQAKREGSCKTTSQVALHKALSVPAYVHAHCFTRASEAFPSFLHHYSH